MDVKYVDEILTQFHKMAHLYSLWVEKMVAEESRGSWLKKEIQGVSLPDKRI